LIKASDIRDMNWEEIAKRLTGPREVIWQDLMKAGEGTTLEIAERTRISVLTVRPRVTELLVMGLAKCSRINRRGQISEGVYAGVSMEDAEVMWERRKRPEQSLLGL